MQHIWWPALIVLGFAVVFMWLAMRDVTHYYRED